MENISRSLSRVDPYDITAPDVEVPQQIVSNAFEKAMVDTEKDTLNILFNADGCVDCTVVDFKMALYHYLYTIYNPFDMKITLVSSDQVRKEIITLSKKLRPVFERFLRVNTGSVTATMLFVSKSTYSGFPCVYANCLYKNKQLLCSTTCVPPETRLSNVGLTVVDASKYFKSSASSGTES